MTKNQKRKKPQTMIQKKTSRRVDDEDNRSDRSFISGKP
jgi:hypothetical protein